jgi:hypothetical protein
MAVPVNHSCTYVTINQNKNVPSGTYHIDSKESRLARSDHQYCKSQKPFIILALKGLGNRSRLLALVKFFGQTREYKHTPKPDIETIIHCRTDSARMTITIIR